MMQVARVQAARPVSGLSSGTGMGDFMGGGVVTMDDQSSAVDQQHDEQEAANPDAVADDQDLASADPVAEHEEPASTPSTKPAVSVPVDVPPASDEMEWFVLKVQSNREKSIRDSLLRRIKREGLEHKFGEVIIPTEKVKETKGGKTRVTERKLYPGYIMIHMILNDETWYLVRDTSGVGDFTGAAGKPIPMRGMKLIACSVVKLRRWRNRRRSRLIWRSATR